MVRDRIMSNVTQQPTIIAAHGSCETTSMTGVSTNKPTTKKLRDPSKPKRAMSAYICFMSGAKGGSMADRVLQWNQLKERSAADPSNSEMTAIELMRTQDKIRYQKQFSEWVPMSDQDLIYYHANLKNRKNAKKPTKTGSSAVMSNRNTYHMFLKKVKGRGLSRDDKKRLWLWMKENKSIELGNETVFLHVLEDESLRDKERFQAQFCDARETELYVENTPADITQQQAGLFGVVTDSLLVTVIRNPCLQGFGFKIASVCKRFQIALMLSSATPKKYIKSGANARNEYGLALMLKDLSDEFFITSREQAQHFLKYIVKARKKTDSTHRFYKPYWATKDNTRPNYFYGKMIDLESLESVLNMRLDKESYYGYGTFESNPWNKIYLGCLLYSNLSTLYGIDLDDCKSIIAFYDTSVRKPSKFRFNKTVNFFSTANLMTPYNLN